MKGRTLRKVLWLFTFLVAACMFGCGDNKGVVPPSNTTLSEKTFDRKTSGGGGGGSQKREGGPQPIK
jgi:hypothetical protein